MLRRKTPERFKNQNINGLKLMKFIYTQTKYMILW